MIVVVSNSYYIIIIIIYGKVVGGKVVKIVRVFWNFWLMGLSFDVESKVEKNFIEVI